MMTRRSLLRLGVAGLAVSAGLPRAFAARAAGPFEVVHTEAEWRALLTPSQYAVLRDSATERPRPSPAAASPADSSASSFAISEPSSSGARAGRRGRRRRVMGADLLRGAVCAASGRRAEASLRKPAA